MNAKKAKLLRKIAKHIGRDPKYIKKHYKAMSPEQQGFYIAYMKNALAQIAQRKEAVGDENLPTLSGTDNSKG